MILFLSTSILFTNVHRLIFESLANFVYRTLSENQLYISRSEKMERNLKLQTISTEKTYGFHDSNVDSMRAMHFAI